jgi:hypothetical protein
MSYYQSRNQGQTITINGRRIPVADGVSGQELSQAAGRYQGRRSVLLDGVGCQTIDPSRYYQASELIGRNGRPVKVTSIPDRTKGGQF